MLFNKSKLEKKKQNSVQNATSRSFKSAHKTRLQLNNSKRIQQRRRNDKTSHTQQSPESYDERDTNLKPNTNSRTHHSFISKYSSNAYFDQQGTIMNDSTPSGRLQQWTSQGVLGSEAKDEDRQRVSLGCKGRAKGLLREQMRRAKSSEEYQAMVLAKQSKIAAERAGRTSTTAGKYLKWRSREGG